jgi:hypothetical protein
VFHQSSSSRNPLYQVRDDFGNCTSKRLRTAGLGRPEKSCIMQVSMGLMLTDRVRRGDRYHSTVMCPSGSAPNEGAGVVGGNVAKT